MKTLTKKQKLIAAAVVLVGGGIALASGGGGSSSGTSAPSTSTAVAPSKSASGLAYGPSISDKRLSEMRVSDIGIGMSIDEARGILEGKGFEGEFRTDTFRATYGTPSPAVRGVGTYNGMDGYVALRTVEDEAGVARVWAVEYQERFPSEQDAQIWVKRISERYGEPSRVAMPGVLNSQQQNQQVVYSVEPVPPSNIARRECGDSSSYVSPGATYGKDSSCRTLNRFDEYGLARNSPTYAGLMAWIEPRHISITLADARYANTLEDKAKATAEAKKSEALERNAADTQVNF